MSDGVFWHATVKTNSYNTGNAFEGTYTMVVVAPSPDVAVSEMEKIVDKYSGLATSDRPTSQILREARGQPIQVDVDEKYLLSDDGLDLHYGEGFQEWSEKFASSLHESGLSVLQGSPGTGKTSYLRHLICSLWETHRFYYIPVESFNLLSSSNLPAICSNNDRSGHLGKRRNEGRPPSLE
jgi:hypothetical protein